MENKEVTGAIVRIYETCLNEANWQQAIDEFLWVIKAKGAILVAQDLNSNPFKLQHHASHYKPEHLKFYMEEMVPYELDAWRNLTRSPALKILTDKELWPGEVSLKKRPDFAWLLETYGVYRRLGARLNDSRGWIDSIGIQFDSEVEEIPKGSIERANILLPHMAKAVEISRSFVVLKQHYQAVMAALDHVRIGMCIVTASGNVEIFNKEAERIFDQSDGIWLSNEHKIDCKSLDLKRKITHAIHAIADTALGHDGPRQFTTTIIRPSNNYPYLLDITPLRDSSGEISTNYYGALVTIIDPDSPKGFEASRITSALSLTKAETDVCQLLVDGRSINEIAERRDVKTDTVRSQLKSIYNKANTTRRDQLIKLILSLHPPIDIPHNKSKQG